MNYNEVSWNIMKYHELWWTNSFFIIISTSWNELMVTGCGISRSMASPSLQGPQGSVALAEAKKPGDFVCLRWCAGGFHVNIHLYNSIYIYVCNLIYTFNIYIHLNSFKYAYYPLTSFIVPNNHHFFQQISYFLAVCIPMFCCWNAMYSWLDPPGTQWLKRGFGTTVDKKGPWENWSSTTLGFSLKIHPNPHWKDHHLVVECVGSSLVRFYCQAQITANRAFLWFQEYHMTIYDPIL